MDATLASASKSADPALPGAQELAALVRSQAATIEQLKHRLAWFERQVFGPKSERLKLLDDPRQLLLGTADAPSEPTPTPTKPVAAHERQRPTRDVAASTGEAESLPFFDRARVPVEAIEVLPAGAPVRAGAGGRARHEPRGLLDRTGDSGD